ncbi:MAG: T9SS type A sorting domain-containing protein [Ignavibacteria bacterium]|nr:T9SS type A sorting domain-containing protein [Ignavibacteria bacterium]
MKKIVYTFLFLSISTLNIYAQQGWFWQNPLPQGNYLSGIIFTENNTSYLIGANGTLIKSTNNGISYFLMENNITENFESFHFVNQNTGFIGTDNGIIYKTTNGGNNFNGTYLGFPDKIISIKFSGNQNGFALMKFESFKTRIFKTSDSGSNWSLCFDVPDSIIIFSISIASINDIYAAGENINDRSRLFRSTNAGSNWELVQTSATGSLVGVHFINQQTGFISQLRFGRKLYRTTNGGINWDSVGNFAPNNFQFLDNLTGFSFGNGYSNSDVYRTSNAGSNWISTGYVTSGTQNLYFKSILNWSQIWTSVISTTSNAGTNWNEISSGFTDYLDDIVFVNPSTGFIASSGGKIYRTTNSGNNWIGFTADNNGINCVDFINENTGFAGANWSHIAKTTNSGINWQVFVIDSLLGSAVHGISFPSIDTGYAVSKNGHNLKTVNGGLTWQVNKLPLTLYFEDVQFLNNNTGYCAGREDRGVIRKTVNGGLNWITYYFDSVFYFTDLHFVNTELGFAVGNKVYNIGFIVRTTNGGITWDYTYLPGTYLLSSVYFVNENVGYAGAEGVSYKTTNGGNDWFRIRTKSPDLHGIYFINENTGYAVGSNGTIIKTTNGGGEPIGIEPISNTLPNEFRLYQNYPNPFNPVTKIKFTIPFSSKSDDVNIQIYDVTGREVRQYPLGNLKAGIYSIDFDGTGFASGVYFCRLISGKFKFTNKMVLIK